RLHRWRRALQQTLERALLQGGRQRSRLAAVEAQGQTSQDLDLGCILVCFSKGSCCLKKGANLSRLMPRPDDGRERLEQRRGRPSCIGLAEQRFCQLARTIRDGAQDGSLHPAIVAFAPGE